MDPEWSGGGRSVITLRHDTILGNIFRVLGDVPGDGMLSEAIFIYCS